MQALTLLLVALAAFQLLRPEIATMVQKWMDTLPIESEQNLVQQFIGWATGLGTQQVVALGFGALVYAALFLLEGVGLWRRKTWAEWLTVVATALPIPLEIYEVVNHLSPLRVAALVATCPERKVWAWAPLRLIRRYVRCLAMWRCSCVFTRWWRLARF